VLILTLISSLSPVNYPELGDEPDPISMLNFERDMLVGGEVDLIEVISADGELIEHDPKVEAPSYPGKYPLIWEWTLQDNEGRIWTELIEVPDPIEMDEALKQQLVDDFQADAAELEADLAENG
jgi:hypothetical protein